MRHCTSPDEAQLLLASLLLERGGCILTSSLPLLHHQMCLRHVSVCEAATPFSPACCCGAAQKGQNAACLCPLLRLDAA
jgi:hypothetical protein